ncbi:MAG: NfeD family protein [Desulfatibacillum sp.]|nr:NfeD family protein [Desulfatibacillum sp.]
MVEALTSPILIWFVFGLVLILAEFAVPGIILVFFGVGAWVVSAMCAMFNASLNLQLLVFLVSSVLCLVFLRGWVQKVFVGHSQDGESGFSNSEVVGQTAVVVEAIKPGYPGKVEFRGTQWKAIAEEPIQESRAVEIVRQDCITLIVKPINGN